MLLTIEEFKICFMILCISSNLDIRKEETLSNLGELLILVYKMSPERSTKELRDIAKQIEDFHEYTMHEMVYQKRKYSISIFVKLMFLQYSFYKFLHPDEKIMDISASIVNAIATLYPEYNDIKLMEEVIIEYQSDIQKFKDIMKKITNLTIL